MQCVNNRHPAVSLVIAVYNKPDFLEKIFVSLQNQTFKDFEIIIADDGSRPEIGDVVESYSSCFRFPVCHVWHEDNGFRKTVIVNKAVKASTAEYLLFIDGDSILHYRFIESHYRYKKINTVLSGRRVMLDKAVSANMTLDDVRLRKIESPLYWWNHCAPGDRKHGFYLPVFFPIDNFFKRKYLILGCNFSMFKSDYYSINGYDERIIGRSMEDSNIDARLKIKGIKIKAITRQALQYHLYHSFAPAPHSPEAIREFCFPSEYWTEYGLVKGKERCVTL